jgi:hypothetical protein
MSLRVVSVNGQLYIDSDTHIPGTNQPSSNGGANSQ